MKKICTLVVALICISFVSNAQRSADIALVNTLRAVDTIGYTAAGTVGRIYVTLFINNGPSALTATDTIKWRSAANGGVITLTLPSTGIPVNDTVYFTDTVVVTTPPTTNPFPWCDSVWAKDNAGAVIPDPNTANNKTCKSVLFVLRNVSVNNIAAGNSDMSLYPNPAGNSLNVSYVATSKEKVSIVIRDITGKIMLSREFASVSSGKQDQTLDVTSLSNGLYMVEINSKSGRAAGKVVISK